MQISWSFEVKVFSLPNSPTPPLMLRAPDSFQREETENREMEIQVDAHACSGLQACKA